MYLHYFHAMIVNYKNMDLSDLQSEFSGMNSVIFEGNILFLAAFLYNYFETTQNVFTDSIIFLTFCNESLRTFVYLFARNEYDKS